MTGSLPEGFAHAEQQVADSVAGLLAAVPRVEDARTCFSQRVMVTGAPAATTTIVFLLAAATAWISSSWPAGRSIDGRSKPSDSSFQE